MKLPLFLIIIVILTVSGCSGQEKEYAQFFCFPENNGEEITVYGLDLECIHPDVTGISYVGYSGIKGDNIYFADCIFSRLYQFNKEGGFEKIAIHKGNGPHEIPTNRIEGYCISDEGHHYFLDSSTNLYEFDDAFNSVNQLLYYWGKKITNGEICELTDSYVTRWGELINFTVNKGRLYTNIIGESENFNITIPAYYKEARIIEQRDARTGAPISLLGRISPAVGYMTAFQGDFFKITDSGCFVVAYEADDLMYVYDTDYKLKYSFGQPGWNMNKNYTPLSVEDFQNMYIQEIKTKGRYTSLSIYGELTFRTYFTGKPSNETRLQIYNKTTLIGDIQVPDGFKVMGYIDPYYYSNIICDEDLELISIYRFKI